MACPCPRSNSKDKKLRITVPIICIIGATGSGKGTLCEKIIAKYGYTRLSPRDMIKKEIACCSAKGKEYCELIKQDDVVPTEDIIKMLKKAIKKHNDRACGFIISGFPRVKEQTEAFEKQISKVDLIIYLWGSEENLVQRVLDRAYKQPENAREDEDEETIRSRIACFESRANCILKQCNTKILRINVDRKPEEIFCDIIPAINNITEQPNCQSETTSTASSCG